MRKSHKGNLLVVNTKLLSTVYDYRFCFEKYNTKSSTTLKQNSCLTNKMK